MGKLKVTLVRKSSQLTKLKATGYLMILGRNLRKELVDKKDDAITELLEKEKLAKSKNRY
tara:strand:+ start:102 stop:281 length:180 start_codon:yes stop_codon:yes gene_type:complete